MKRQIMTNNSEFYCLNCGKRGIPIMRKVGKQKADKHRKKMYCPYCRLTLNHIEIKNYEDKLQFLEDFKAGNYQEEAQESIQYTQAENKNWQIIEGLIS